MSSQTHPPGGDFDAPLPPGGYRWWHVDADSEDGRHGITLAAFLGSPVSVRGQAGADPLDRCTLLVALRGTGRGRWSMTERGGAEIARWPCALIIGLNAALWSGETLSFGIDDLTAPWPARLRGTVHVDVPALPGCRVPLDPSGLHRWWPLAGRAHVRVEMQRPDCAWNGYGWVDAQDGDAPLDVTFHCWSRSRARLGESTIALHEFLYRDGSVVRLARRIDPAGRIEECEPPQSAALPRTRWGLPRLVPADGGQAGRVIRTLVDAPFYARSRIEAPLFGAATQMLHETLSFDRLRRRSARLLLSLRSPRAWS